jgi:carboxypeptidase C (cathepsin A)
MITPYSDSRYILQHLPRFVSPEGDPGSQERTELKLYRGGHMFYLDPASRKAFTADARTVYSAP